MIKAVKIFKITIPLFLFLFLFTIQNVTLTKTDAIAVAPIDCQDPNGLLNTINNPPSQPSATPILAQTTVDSATGITISTYQHVTDTWLDAPGIAVSADGVTPRTRNFAITTPPGYDPNKKYPMMIFLHGGCGDFDDHLTDLPEAKSIIVLHPGDPNTAYENKKANCTLQGKIPHFGYMSNFSTYIDTTTNLERTSGTITTNALFVDYTQRRYRYYIAFATSTYPTIDANAIFVRGHSKGGAGTVYTTLFNQDIIAGGISDVLRPNIAPLSLPYVNACNNYGYNMFRYADMAWWIQNHPDQLNFWIQTDHGKDDTAALYDWFNYPSVVSNNLSFFDTLEQYKVAHYTIWDEGGHNKNNGSLPGGNAGGDAGASFDMDLVLGFHWWDGAWSVINDTTTYLRLNKSFPAFSRFSYNQNYGIGPSEADCSGNIDPVYGTNLCKGVIGTAGDNLHNGAIAGVLNRHLRWNSNTIVDNTNQWSIEIKILDDSYAKTPTDWEPTCGTVTPPANNIKDGRPLVYPPCYDDYTGDGTETVDITPRRLQTFKISAGEIIVWSSNLGQSGTVTADTYGVVTIPGFEVTKEWKTLTIQHIDTTPPSAPTGLVVE